MNFLEAHRTVRAFSGGSPLRFLLAGSGTLETLQVFLGAVGAMQGRAVSVRMLPFNTFGQFLVDPPSRGEIEVVLLTPWDLAPEADWRSGIPANRPVLGTLLDGARGCADRLKQRGARVLYLDAPVPSIMADRRENRLLSAGLRWVAESAGADVIAGEHFSLAAYFASGCPVGGGSLWPIAMAAVSAAISEPPVPAKILVTDLDHVMWHGVLAEDGLGGVHFGPEGVGFRHFVYQSALTRFKREGVLLAVVSRNDPQVVAEALSSGTLQLNEADFIAVLASYGAKSAQISALATRLNLSLDSFVFVDDNPIELEEVQRQLPMVRTVPFPDKDEEFPVLMETLQSHLGRREITNEDAERTELYRRRMDGMAVSGAEGADLTQFLRNLGMRLTIHDRSAGDRSRAVQLINKTNQFNLNGRRLGDDAVAAVLASEGRLFTASLEDRTGSHGEILAYLVDHSGTVLSFVMSCRVFQRRVEHAFLLTLVNRGMAPRRFLFAKTDRNEPFCTFAAAKAFTHDGDALLCDPEAFVRDNGGTLELFQS